LGKGALVIACILFVVAAAVVGIALWLVLATGPLPSFGNVQQRTGVVKTVCGVELCFGIGVSLLQVWQLLYREVLLEYFE
jgi:hypothetical protein